MSKPEICKWLSRRCRILSLDSRDARDAKRKNDLKTFVTNQELGPERPLNVGFVSVWPMPSIPGITKIELRRPAKNTLQSFHSGFSRLPDSARDGWYWSEKKRASPPASRCWSPGKQTMVGAVLAAAAENQKINFGRMPGTTTGCLVTVASAQTGKREKTPRSPR